MTDRKTCAISIILPVLDEAARLPAVLAPLVGVDGVEVLVVDGGSVDASIAISEKMGVPVLRSERGRARQMNFGADRMSGKILLFLHGDTVLPGDFARQIAQAMLDKAVVAGAFRLAIDAGGVGIRLVENLANLRARFFDLPYGDQALFVRREIFQALGGFPDLPIMEDFAMVRQLRKRGRLVLLRAAASTSGRRWQKLGVWRTTLVNQLMVLGFLLGVSPGRLARFYRRG